MISHFARICLLASFAMAAHAQLATTTSLVGTVTDPSGKAVSGATVIATETRTLDRYNASTNEQGYYTVEFVRVGVYSVTVEHAGFQKVTNTGIASTSIKPCEPTSRCPLAWCPNPSRCNRP